MPFGDYSGTKSGGTSRWGGSSSDSGNNFSVAPIEKQIANTNMRIQDAGYTPQDTDNRNWFEKLTNLPQGQNGFLDTLELLGRPGSAIKNVIDKSVLQNTNDGSVENPLTAAWKGISGQDRVTGADLADKMGFKSGVGKFVVGTGLDIGTDPTSYIPAGLIAKGIGSIAKPIGGLAKGAYDAVEAASPAIKGFRTNTVEPAINAAKDTLGRAFVPQYKWDETLTGGANDTLKNLYRDTNNTRDFMNENAMQNIGDIAKTTGIDAGTDVGRLAEKDLRQFQDVKGYEFPDGVTRTENKRDLLNVMNQNKKNISDISSELSPTKIELPNNVGVGTKAFELSEKNIPATKFKPQQTVMVTPRGSVAKPIAEIKDINGVKNYRFDGESSFVPESKIRPVGSHVLTKTGEYKAAIGEFNNALDQTNKQISKLYFGLERNAGKEIDSATKANLRDAARESSRLDSQINNFGQVENSMLRDYKKQIRAAHDSNFDILKSIRKVAPNGIKAAGFELPGKLKSLVRTSGKGIDEVADELGYKYANDLLQDVKRLDSMPRKLSNEELTAKAMQEMDRTGAKQHLADTLQSLSATRDAVKQSLLEISKGLGDASKAQGKAFADLSAHPEYNSLNAQKEALQAQRDALRNESKQAQQSGIEKIKGLQGSNEDLKQSLQNPVMIQKEIPRPVREYSNDPAVLNATKHIVESNDVLRQWATDNDIPIGEIDGYMKHILSQEERDLRKVNPKAVDRSMSTMNNPDKKVLNPRKLMGSAEDTNDRLGRKFFEDNAYKATAIGQKQIIDYGTSVKFRRDILSNPDFAKPFKEGMSVSDHHELIDTNNYTFMKNDDNSLPEQIGGKYIVTKGVKEALDRYQGLATDEGTKGMIKAFDALQNTWKKMALFSPGFHIRNVAGAMFNNSVAGMNPYNLVKYTKEAAGEVASAVKGNESALFREYRGQGLSSSGISKVEFAKVGEAPEKAIIRTVDNMSKTGKDKVISKLKTPFQTSQEVGDITDQVNRFALYKWARESKKMSPEEAAAKVKETQYDYKDLTPFERNVMKRVIPFYTWSRKNIPFQLKSFVNDPRPYLGIDKISKNAQSTAGLDENNMPNFMKENFSIPVTKSQMLGLNLPLGDLTKLTSPLKTVVDGLSPILKTPIELASNYSLFKGKPIEKFAGQDKKYLGGLAIPAKLDYAIQAATGQIGKGLSGYLGDAGNVSQDNKFRTPSLGLSVVKPYDAEKSAYYQKLDELKQLQDYLLYIQQQTGEKPRTTAEIKKSGSSRW